MASNNIEEMIKKSTCFGIAYDGTVRECKICEVRLKCENKCRMGVDTPTQKPAAAPMADKDEVSLTDEAMAKSRAKEEKVKKSLKEKKTTTTEYSADMPDFKPMSVEELESLLVERGGNTSDFDKYTNPSIKKMRLTMALKKTYEVGK